MRPGTARGLVAKAIKDGVLVRPETCSRCGSKAKNSWATGNIEAHHEDYSKPLDVIWLCKTCHRYANMQRASREPYCKRGHEMTPENTVVYRSGWKRCVICLHEQKLVVKARRKAQMELQASPDYIGILDPRRYSR